jgi:hypothetical protein
MDIKPKQFIVVPRDAMEMLSRRFATYDEAVAAGEEACPEEGQTMYVIELKASIARETPPVKVRKL